MWPGYGENSRVLKWIFERCDGTAHAVETPIGRLPAPSDLDTQGLDISPANLAKLLEVDVEGWSAEVPMIREFFAEFGDRMPTALKEKLTQLEKRLKSEVTTRQQRRDGTRILYRIRGASLVLVVLEQVGDLAGGFVASWFARGLMCGPVTISL